MASAVFLFKKFLYFTLIVGLLPSIADGTEIATGASTMSKAVVIVFMIVTVLPELSLVFPAYRREILNGIQDGDGITNKEDLKFFFTWYILLCCGRAIIFSMLFSMVEPSWETPSEIVWALVAVIGGTSATQIKNIFGKS